ncbi:unnamed protein product [Owenia fusiformis]|uniref:Ras modification protein ERF4 n=1 Tax=Owenia fusiformis TaxID=6347 RepID=A0A8J1TBE1_OWEFU|nr:unnamed protein product [Owenia fusiformis]
MANQGNNIDDMGRIPPPNCTKIFISRDFSEGTTVKFLTKFPTELEGKIDKKDFDATMNRLNELYTEAESLSSKSYCESCFACLSAYLVYMCMDTHYEKVLKKIGRFLQDQNDNVYLPRGLMLIDPIERGLRCLEICILTETSPSITR